MTLPDAVRGALRSAIESRIGEHADALDVDELVSAVEQVLVGKDGDSPPWAPARYRLPDERIGTTGTLVIHAEDETAVYAVTVGYYDDGRLGELFVRQEREGGTTGALLDAVATVISIGLQYGVPWEVFAAKLAHQRFEPSGFTEDKSGDLRMVSSPLDYLARWVSKRARRTTDAARSG